MQVSVLDCALQMDSGPLWSADGFVFHPRGYLQRRFGLSFISAFHFEDVRFYHRFA